MLDYGVQKKNYDRMSDHLTGEDWDLVADAIAQGAGSSVSISVAYVYGYIRKPAVSTEIGQ